MQSGPHISSFIIQNFNKGEGGSDSELLRGEKTQSAQILFLNDDNPLKGKTLNPPTHVSSSFSSSAIHSSFLLDLLYGLGRVNPTHFTRPVTLFFFHSCTKSLSTPPLTKMQKHKLATTGVFLRGPGLSLS